MWDRFIPADKIPILEGATAGATILLLMLGQLNWRLTLLVFVSGLTLACFGTQPVGAYFHIAPAWNGLIGCLFGFGAMFGYGGLLTILRGFESDPFSIVGRVLSIFRGGQK